MLSPRVIHSDEASPGGGCRRVGHGALPLSFFLGTALAAWYWRFMARQPVAQAEWAALGAQLGQWTVPAMLASETDHTSH